MKAVIPDQTARRLETQKRWARVDDSPEAEYARYATVVSNRVVKPVAPVACAKPAPAPKLKGWPMSVLESADAQLGAIWEIAPVTTKTLVLGAGQSLTFRRIPAGTFVMGSADGYPDERPQAVVRIAKPFWISEMEIQNQQYNVFDPEHDSRYQDEFGKDHVFPGHIGNHRRQPVVRVTWNDAMRFCAWLSKTCNVKATLPTEAQWEELRRPRRALPGRRLRRRRQHPQAQAVRDLAELSAARGALGGRLVQPQLRGTRELQPLGPLRHARQRGGVDAQRLRAVSVRRWRRTKRRKSINEEGRARRIVRVASA